MQLHAVEEIIPPWELKKKQNFKGYPTLFHALTVCSAQKKICAVCNIGAKIELSPNVSKFYANYRVYITERNKHIVDESIFEARLDFTNYRYPKGISDIRLTHVYKRTNQKGWTDRLQDLSGAKDPIKEVRQMMMDFMDLRNDEIHTNPYSFMFKDVSLHGIKTERERAVLYDDSSVNYNQYKTVAETRAVANTYNVNIRRACRAEPISERPKIHIVLNDRGIAKTKSEISFMSAIVHEGMHAINSYRVLYLIDKWTKYKTKKNFFTWVIKLETRKHKNRRGKLFYAFDDDLIRVLEKCELPEPEYTGNTSNELSTYKYDLKHRKTFTDEERKALLPTMIARGIGFGSTLHFYPHLEGFKLKVWLIDRSKLIANPTLFSNDIDKMNEFYVTRKHISGTRKIAKEVAGTIKKVLESVDKQIKIAVQKYLEPQIAEDNFFKILYDILK